MEKTYTIEEIKEWLENRIEESDNTGAKQHYAYLLALLQIEGIIK